MYGISYPGGIAFADNAHRVVLDDFEFDVADKFIYEYNFHEFWTIEIRIEDIKTSDRPSSICCKKGSGMLGADKYDESEATINLLKAIFNAEDVINLDELRLHVDALLAVRFNRTFINEKLHSVFTETAIIS